MPGSGGSTWCANTAPSKNPPCAPRREWPASTTRKKAMTTENPTDPTQQTNPVAEGQNADAAKPDGEAATEPNPPGGQGNGETAAATDEVDTGDGQDAAEPEG